MPALFHILLTTDILCQLGALKQYLHVITRAVPFDAAESRESVVATRQISPNVCGHSCVLSSRNVQWKKNSWGTSLCPALLQVHF